MASEGRVSHAPAVSATNLTTLATLASNLPKRKNRTQWMDHPDSMNDTKRSETSLKSFIAGGIGGAAEVIVGHPLDLIKVRMQMAEVNQVSVLRSVQKIICTKGLTGLYCGISAPLAVVTPLEAVSFWSYDIGKRGIRHYFTYGPARELSTLESCSAGAFSAIPTTVLMAPSERVKVVMQVNPQRYDTLWKSFTDVYAHGGIRSLYRGTALTLLRDGPGSAVYFGVYEYTKRTLRKLSSDSTTSKNINDKTSTPVILTAGGLAGVACCFVMLPFDVLKSRQQAAATSLTMKHVFCNLVRTRGGLALFQGLQPALLRAFPANAACFLGVEATKEALKCLDG